MAAAAGEGGGTVRPRRRSSAELRALVLEAAGVEFERGGFGGATTAAIARRAGTTEAQLFRLFPSKQALFRAAVFEPLERQLAAFMASHPERGAADRHRAAGAYVGELQTFLEQHARMLMSLIVASLHGQEPEGELADLDSLRRYFDQGARRMAERLGEGSAVDPRLMVRVSFAAVLGATLCRDWLFTDELAEPARIRRAVTDFVVAGVGIGAVPGAPPGDGEA